MTLREYVRAVNAALGQTTLNKIIYYCGFDSDLNEPDVKAIIAMALERKTQINSTIRYERARMARRNIANIQA